MDDNLQQHYADLWHLADSLKSGWWGGAEKVATRSYLETAAAADPNFTSLNPRAPDFLIRLELELKSLALSNPDLGKTQIPPRTVVADPVKKAQLKTLENLQEKFPVVFQDKDGHQPNLPKEEVFLILKRNGLVDDQGKYYPGSAAAIQKTQSEIGQRLTYYQYRQSLREEMATALIEYAPVGLTQAEFFGKDGVPGIVQEMTDKFAEVVTADLHQRMAQKQGGAINFAASDFQAVFDSSVSELKTELRFGSLGRQKEQKVRTSKIILSYLQRSTHYQRLTPIQQEELRLKARNALLEGVKRTGAPLLIGQSQLVLSPTGELTAIELTPIAYQDSARKATTFSAIPTQPQNIAGKVAQEVGQVVKSDFNSGANIVATKKLQDFWEGLAADPTSAILHYPVNSLLHLLPRPLQNWYFKQTGTQDAWKELQKKYFYATSPEGLRLFTQDMVYRGAKAALRPLGLTNDKGQWVWASAFGWMTNKATTNVGEGLASLTGHIPLVGNFLSKTFKRRLGKNRNRDEELAASVVGIFLDIGTGILKILPKLALRFVNQIPAVKQFKALVTQKYFALESRFGLFRTLRVAGGSISSFARGVFSLNTVAGAGWGNIIGTALGIGPAGTIIGGIGGALYQGWFNIAKNGGLVRLLTRATSGYMGTYNATGELTGMIEIPKLNVFEKFFRIIDGPGVWMAKHGGFRLPIKGGLVSYLLVQAGVPLPLALIPTFLEYFWETKGWWANKFASWGARLAGRVPILSRVGDFFSGLASRFGFLGRFANGLAGLAGKIFFAIPYIPLVAELLGGAPLLVALGHWLPTAMGFWGVAQILIELSGGWGALMSGAAAGLGFIGATFTALTGALSTALTGIAAIATSAVFATVVAVAGIALVVTIITAGAFINYSKYQGSVAPIVSECFAPIKTVQVWHNGAVVPDQKAQAGDTLVYTINLNPKSKVNEEIKNVVVVDEFAICSEYPGVGPSPAGTKYDLLDINKLNIYPGSAFQAEGPRPPTTGLNANKPCFREIIWKASSSISSLTRNTEIKYSVQVHGNYPAMANFAPAISNLVMVDGEYEITEASGVKRKANCRASITTTVNFSGELVGGMAEKIINALYKCNQRCVTSQNRDKVVACLRQYAISDNIPSIEIVISEILRSVSNNVTNNIGYLQCVGFVQAVEKATGGNLWRVNLAAARDYWTNLSQWGYEQKPNNATNQKTIKPGDILIWTKAPLGHMAIVVKPVFDPDGNLMKIIYADAIGTDGCVSHYPLENTTFTSPDAPFLVGWQTRR